jgi:hypothetical protein
VAIDPLVGTIVRVLPTPPGQSHDLSQRFTVGQILKGIVLRALPEGKTLVNFAGQHLILELGQPMLKGQTFLAAVEQSAPTLALKVISDPAPNSNALASGQQALAAELGETTPPTPGTLNAAQLTSYLVAKQPLGNMVAALQNHLINSPLWRTTDPTLLQRLEQTLAALLPQDPSPPDAAGLKEQVARSGINYEAKVQHVLTSNASPLEQAALANDLKGQLLEVLHKLDQASTRNGETVEIHQHVQQALHNIEFQQLSNLFAQQENQSLLLQLMHPTFPASHTAKLYFRANPRQSGGSQAESQDYTLVFLLDFTALGNLRIDASVRGPSVSATIRTEDETVADFIVAQTPSLTARLHDLGFQAEIRCCAQETVSLDIDDSLTRVLMAKPSRLLDIKV